ncbi:hypothetical protein [Streptomyces sp. NPDC086989]|uniref:hypothetical protein n=1 Tax=Streptomyces sp. NPDC086989 TaxID=3365764 RepID=UPI0038219CCF
MAPPGNGPGEPRAPLPALVNSAPRNGNRVPEPVEPLGVTVTASCAFGVIAVALFAMGLGPWSLLPLVLLVPAALLAGGYGLLVFRTRPRTPQSGPSGMAE